MSDLYPTHTRRRLLGAVDRGRVRITQKGDVIHADGALNRRADAAIREVEAAGWVRLGPDGGTYELTDDGRNVIGGVDAVCPVHHTQLRWGQCVACGVDEDDS